MSSATATFHPNSRGIYMLISAPDGEVGRGLARLCNRIVGTSQGFANVDTGLMRSRIEFTIESDGRDLVGVIAARTDYSYYVHEGTWFMDGNPFLTDAAAIEIERGLT